MEGQREYFHRSSRKDEMYNVFSQDAEEAASSLRHDPIIAGHQTILLLQVVQMAS